MIPNWQKQPFFSVEKIIGKISINGRRQIQQISRSIYRQMENYPGINQPIKKAQANI